MGLFLHLDKFARDRRQSRFPRSSRVGQTEADNGGKVRVVQRLPIFAGAKKANFGITTAREDRVAEKLITGGQERGVGHIHVDASGGGKASFLQGSRGRWQELVANTSSKFRHEIAPHFGGRHILVWITVDGQRFFARVDDQPRSHGLRMGAHMQRQRLEHQQQNIVGAQFERPMVFESQNGRLEKRMVAATVTDSRHRCPLVFIQGKG